MSLYFIAILIAGYLTIGFLVTIFCVHGEEKSYSDSSQFWCNFEFPPEFDVDSILCLGLCTILWPFSLMWGVVQIIGFLVWKITQ